ncbi:MAG: DNA-binding protein [Lachnospiraceae bacterium]|nr:DNA-binding protein [Lachnospiraceae bacterium]MBR1524585.1 DNA-binding protein [Lachnospiraceae bacterium]
MEKLIERGLLFDYYGGLLSEKNKRIYEAAVDDMSLSEIADESGISRQAVSEALRRTDDKLKRYEKELGLIERAGKLEAEIKALKDAVGEDIIDRQKLKAIIDRMENTI